MLTKCARCKKEREVFVWYCACGGQSSAWCSECSFSGDESTEPDPTCHGGEFDCPEQGFTFSEKLQ